MKKDSLAADIIKTVVVLVIIAGVAGALLGLVNHFTYMSDDEVMARKATAVYNGELKAYQSSGMSQQIEYSNGSVLGVYVPSDSTPDVYVVRAEGTGAYKGKLQLLVNITGGKIVKIATYDADETPGLGGKALTDSFFKQYYGINLATLDGGAFAVVKTSENTDKEIRAITGASKSSTAVTNAVNAATKWYIERIVGGVK